MIVLSRIGFMFNVSLKLVYPSIDTVNQSCLWVMLEKMKQAKSAVGGHPFGSAPISLKHHVYKEEVHFSCFMTILSHICFVTFNMTLMSIDPQANLIMGVIITNVGEH